MASGWAQPGSSHWGLSRGCSQRAAGATITGASTELNGNTRFIWEDWMEGGREARRLCRSRQPLPGARKSSGWERQGFLGLSLRTTQHPCNHLLAVQASPGASPRSRGGDATRASAPETPSPRPLPPSTLVLTCPWPESGHRPLPPSHRRGHWGWGGWPSRWECPTIRAPHQSVLRSHGAGWPLPPRHSCDFIVVDPHPDPFPQRPGTLSLPRQTRESRAEDLARFYTAANPLL